MPSCSRRMTSVRPPQNANTHRRGRERAPARRAGARSRRRSRRRGRCRACAVARAGREHQRGARAEDHAACLATGPGERGSDWRRDLAERLDRPREERRDEDVRIARPAVDEHRRAEDHDEHAEPARRRAPGARGRQRPRRETPPPRAGRARAAPATSRPSDAGPASHAMRTATNGAMKSGHPGVYCANCRPMYSKTQNVRTPRSNAGPSRTRAAWRRPPPGTCRPTRRRCWSTRAARPSTRRRPRPCRARRGDVVDPHRPLGPPGSAASARVERCPRAESATAARPADRRTRAPRPTPRPTPGCSRDRPERRRAEHRDRHEPSASR